MSDNDKLNKTESNQPVSGLNPLFKKLGESIKLKVQKAIT